MESTDRGIGQRVREVRVWRGLSLRAASELAGMTAGHLSNIEKGHRRIDKRSTLEAVAMALRVSPTDLTGQPWLAMEHTPESDMSLVAVETALDIYELGEDPGGPVREWPQIAADITRLQDLMHVHADYAAQAALAPKLMAELHAVYARDGGHRADALLGLLHCASSAVWVTKRLGGRGLPGIAARFAQQCAEELGCPEWLGYTAWLRGDATGQLSRRHQYERSVAMADRLSAVPATPEITQAHGMLHLSSALAAAAQNDQDTALTHLGEASAIADRMDDEVGLFARMWFGRQNVGVWKVSLATEFGDTDEVMRVAPGVHPEAIPSPSRNAEFLCDVGRSLMTHKRTTEQGLEHILKAETLAPQRVRHDSFVREATMDAMRTARREAGGRELRGLAYRMGLAV